jgi:hypothetical protein
MPLLVMRDYPGTLLDETYRTIVNRQINMVRSAAFPKGNIGIGLQRPRPPEVELPVRSFRRTGFRFEARAN